MPELLLEFIHNTGFSILLSRVCHDLDCLFFTLPRIVKKYEPLLLIPISFGILLVNLPLGNLIQAETATQSGGLLYYFSRGLELGIFPPLIFLGIGAMTDFGPLIANPVTLLLGAAAQLGVFLTFIGAYALGFTLKQAGAVGIIGGADGPPPFSWPITWRRSCWAPLPLPLTPIWPWCRSFNRRSCAS